MITRFFAMSPKEIGYHLQKPEDVEEDREDGSWKSDLISAQLRTKRQIAWMCMLCVVTSALNLYLFGASNPFQNSTTQTTQLLLQARERYGDPKDNTDRQLPSPLDASQPQ